MKNFKNYSQKVLFLFLILMCVLNFRNLKAQEKGNKNKQNRKCNYSKKNSKIIRFKKERKRKRRLSKGELIDRIKKFAMKAGVLKNEKRIYKEIKFEKYSGEKNSKEIDFDGKYWGSINIYTGDITLFRDKKSLKGYKCDTEVENDKLEKIDIEKIKKIGENRIKNAAKAYITKLLGEFPKNVIYKGYEIIRSNAKPQIKVLWKRHYKGIKFQTNHIGIKLTKDLKFACFYKNLSAKFDPNFMFKIEISKAIKLGRKYAERVIKQFRITGHKIVKFLGVELKIVKPNFLLDAKNMYDFKKPANYGRVAWIIKHRSKDTTGQAFIIPQKTIHIWIDVETGKCLGGAF